MEASMNEGPLKGIKIIDASSVLMVPYCTKLLADMGAEIIKIETIDGDITRHIGPTVNKGMGAVFLNINRISFPYQCRCLIALAQQPATQPLFLNIKTISAERIFPWSFPYQCGCCLIMSCSLLPNMSWTPVTRGPRYRRRSHEFPEEAMRKAKFN